MDDYSLAESLVVASRGIKGFAQTLAFLPDHPEDRNRLR